MIKPFEIQAAVSGFQDGEAISSGMFEWKSDVNTSGCAQFDHFATESNWTGKLGALVVCVARLQSGTKNQFFKVLSDAGAVVEIREFFVLRPYNYEGQGY